jgi:hypothetical protein
MFLCKIPVWIQAEIHKRKWASINPSLWSLKAKFQILVLMRKKKRIVLLQQQGKLRLGPSVR